MSFHLVSPEIQRYAEVHTTPESEVLQNLNQYTQQHIYSPQMLSGHLQGSLLTLISKILQPKNILEIGTYTGYSALCMVQGLQAGGHLHSLDKNEETMRLAQAYIDKCGRSGDITLHLGDAATIIPTLNVTFDLVFIDADKRGYSKYYEMVMERLQSGGVILADNVLFNAEVLLPQEQRSKAAEALHLFNEQIKNDDRVENVLLPIRDGIMLIRKK